MRLWRWNDPKFLLHIIHVLNGCDSSLMRKGKRKIIPVDKNLYPADNALLL